MVQDRQLVTGRGRWAKTNGEPGPARRGMSAAGVPVLLADRTGAVEVVPFGIRVDAVAPGSLAPLGLAGPGADAMTAS
jgi:hypothetical protein